MKTSKILFALILSSLLFSSCIISFSNTDEEKKHQEKIEEKYTRADFIGKWYSTSPEGKPEITSLDFVNDSIVKINLKEVDGDKIITGQWEPNYKLENKGFGLVSDLQISYMLNESMFHKVLFSVENNNNEILLSSNNLKFVKK